MRFYLAVLLLGVAVNARPQEKKNGRVLSIFSLVNFHNVDCQAMVTGTVNGFTGTCMSTTECSNKGGMHQGNCAAGFGACCVTQVTACTADVPQNNTFISNLGFPAVLGAANTGAACTYTITRMPDICWLRLDFQQVELTPGTNGLVDATANRIQVQNKAGFVDPPVVSGTLSGDHMYAEVRGAVNNPTVTVTTVANAANQRWNIRISQLSCQSKFIPDLPGCTQWMMDTMPDAGQLRSYGSRGAAPQELASQDMKICIRKKLGGQSVTLTAVIDSFNVGMASTGGAIDASGSTVPTCVGLGALLVVGGPAGGIFCENRFNPVEDQTGNAQLTIQNPNTVVLFYQTIATGSQGTGFVINYQQT